jgi:hypothetical protein
MSIRITRLATLVAAMLFATGASSQAAYVLTELSLTPTSFTSGLTSFTFAPTAGGVQNGSAASNFNVIDVGVSSTQAGTPDTGSVTIVETFSLVGTTGTEFFTLSGTLNLLSGSAGGVVSTFSGTTTVTGGSGFTVGFSGYAPPSPGSGGTGGSTGNISILVIPVAATVPEPASAAMLGLGLISVGGFVLRRRMAK